MISCPIRAPKRIESAWDVGSPQARGKRPAAGPRARARAPGFTPRNQVTYNEVNLDQLTQSFQVDAEVTPESLEQAHLLRDPRNPVVILGRGEMNVALKVRVHRVSAGAKAKIEAAGGSVELIG